LKVALSLRAMKFIDRFVGLPLCLLATAVTALFRPNRAAYPSSANKILIIKFLGMGSIVLMAPAIKKLRQKYPGCRITFLTFGGNSQLLEMIPDVDNTIAIRNGAGIAGFIRDTAHVLYRLRRERFDLLIDCEFLTRFSALITFLSRAKLAVGFHAWETYRGQLHDIRVPFNYYWHITRNFSNLLTGDGDCDEEPTIPQLRVPNESQIWAARFLGEHGVRDGDLVVIVNPNAGELALERRWPRMNFVELLRALEREYGAKVFLIGGKAEEAYTTGIALEAGTRGARSLAGALSIPQLAALLSVADLLITNDRFISLGV